MLNLSHRAMGISVDVGKITYLLENCTSVSVTQRLMGKFVINGDSWTTAACEGLERVDKDAEVDFLCLLLMWSKDKPYKDKLVTMVRDLVFDCQFVGSGTKLCSYQLANACTAEAERQAVGWSGWRKCLFLVKMHASVILEGRVPDEKDEGMRLYKVFKEDKV